MDPNIDTPTQRPSPHPTYNASVELWTLPDVVGSASSANKHNTYDDTSTFLSSSSDGQAEPSEWYQHDSFVPTNTGIDHVHNAESFLSEPGQFFGNTVATQFSSFGAAQTMAMGDSIEFTNTPESQHCRAGRSMLHGLLNEELRQLLHSDMDLSSALDIVASIADKARRSLDSWLLEKTSETSALPTASSQITSHNPDMVEPMSIYPMQTDRPLDMEHVLHSKPTLYLNEMVGVIPRKRAKYVSRLPGDKLLLNCTTCDKSSTGLYDWNRHEASHFKPWMCMPDGTHLIGDYCGVCGERDESGKHGQIHKKLVGCKYSCRGQDKLEEHLKTHLALPRGVSLPRSLVLERRELLKAWEHCFAPDSGALWCGFCLQYCQDSSKRQKHVLQHLKNGESMLGWVRSADYNL